MIRLLLKKGTIVMNTDKITKEYLMPIVGKLIRYISLMGNQGEIFTSTDTSFSIVNEPLSREITITYIATTVNDVVHKFEHIFKTDLSSNETEYTLKEYEQAFKYYNTDFDEVVGTVTIHHHIGDRVVIEYAKYQTDTFSDLFTTENGECRTFRVAHTAGDPIMKYEYYEETVRDATGVVIHTAGDVMKNLDGSLCGTYAVKEYDYSWRLYEPTTI